MKAICRFEMELPKSCIECKLRCGNSCIAFGIDFDSDLDLLPTEMVAHDMPPFERDRWFRFSEYRHPKCGLI